MNQMVLKTTTINQDVVKVHHHTYSQRRLQHLSHLSPKNARSICKFERHQKPLKETMRLLEGRFPFTSRMYSHSEPAIQSNISSNLEIGNRYLIVILLVTLLSIHPPRTIRESKELGREVQSWYSSLIYVQIYVHSKEFSK